MTKSICYCDLSNFPRFCLMHLGFKESASDIYSVVGICIASLAVAYTIQINSVISWLIAGSASGYLTVAALLPSKGSPKWGERLTLSLGVGTAEAASIATLFEVGKSENSYRLGVLALAALVLGAGSLARFRRFQLPVNDRLEGRVEIEISAWRGKNPSYKISGVALGVAILLCLISTSYLSIAVQHPGRFTEFYFLGTSSEDSSYASRLNISQLGTVVVGTANHEGVHVSYAVRMDLMEVQLRYNASAGIDEILELNRTTLSWTNYSLPSGQNWTQPFTFRINGAGFWKLEFLLYKDDIPTTQKLELFIHVP